MKRILKALKKHFFSPLRTAGTYMVSINRELINGGFEQVWVEVPLDRKLTWLFFAVNTIGILTMIELLFLHK